MKFAGGIRRRLGAVYSLQEGPAATGIRENIHAPESIQRGLPVKGRTQAQIRNSAKSRRGECKHDRWIQIIHRRIDGQREFQPGKAKPNEHVTLEVSAVA